MTKKNITIITSIPFAGKSLPMQICIPTWIPLIIFHKAFHVDWIISKEMGMPTPLLLYKSSICISIKTNINKMIEALGHNQIWLDPQLSKAKLIFSTLTKPLSHGKIGIWPVGHYKAAQHESKNQPKGTPVWKNETIGKAEYWELLIDCVLPAVLERFPTAYFNCHGLCIQHDGAKSHIPPDNTD